MHKFFGFLLCFFSLISLHSEEQLSWDNRFNPPVLLSQSQLDREGNTLKKTIYDTKGRKTKEIHSVVRPDNSTAQFTVSCKYDSHHRLKELCEEDSDKQRTLSYKYNAHGQVIEAIKPDGVRLHFVYDKEGRLTLLTASDNSVGYRYTYDSHQNATLIEDLIHSVTLRRLYNESNKLTEEFFPNGLVVINSFDEQGKRTLLTLPDGSHVQYVYEDALLKEIKRLFSLKIENYAHRYTSYDQEGKLTSAQLIGDLGTLSLHYNEDKTLASVQSLYWSETISQKDCNAKGNPTKINFSDTVGSFSVHYHYDDSQRLIEELNDSSLHYTYDSIGNRHSKNNMTYTIGEFNQLNTAGETQYSYNENGCLIEKRCGEELIAFSYDALNRLTIACRPDNWLVSYSYDCFGRCMSKTVSNWNRDLKEWTLEKCYRYLYDGDNEIAIYLNNEMHALRVLGVGKGAEIGAAVAIELDHQVFAPIHDHCGSVRILVDIASGSPSECYRYSAFGEITYFDASGSTLQKSALQNPWLFSSKRLEEETGFIFFGKRFYDPSVGRWITPDPLGYLEGANRYCFVQNNPVALQDPYGLFSFSSAWDTISSSLLSAYDAFMTAASDGFSYLKENFSYSRHVKSDMDAIAHKVCTPTFLSMVGYFEDIPETGTYGKGELNDKVRVTAINGILNLRKDILATIHDLSEAHGGVNIHYVFYPTQGWGMDVLKAAAIKFGYVSLQARQLADTWKRLIKEMGGTQGGGLIIHYAHSIGATNTCHAKNFLTPEEQRMIRVITVGSPSLIPDEGFESVRHYVSCRDGVSLLDPIGIVNGFFVETSNVVYLGTIFGFPFIDHQLSSNTYKHLIEALGKEFLNWHQQKVEPCIE